jgi:hypothetical protein
MTMTAIHPCISIALLAAPLLIPTTDARGGEFTRLKSDERIVFYPAITRLEPGRAVWRSEIRGVIFEPQRARASVAALREAFEMKTDDLTDAESAMFQQRARLFLVDHERGRKIFIRIGTNEFFAGKSGSDGTFAGSIEFGEHAFTRRSTTNHAAGHAASQSESHGNIEFAAVLAREDSRSFTGRLFPLTDAGVSVISDIDDTIKITQVPDREAMLKNTFLREFQPAPGMAEFYATLARTNHAAFHYVSASPWQLYEPLSEFARSNGFPAGTFHLKPFRWKSRKISNLSGDPMKYKLGVIEPLMKQFSQREFILIGDSGERDPEIYGELARRFPKQIKRIYIRDVTGESAESARYEKVFRNLPDVRLQVFTEPGQITIVPDQKPD